MAGCGACGAGGVGGVWADMAGVVPRGSAFGAGSAFRSSAAGADGGGGVGVDVGAGGVGAAEALGFSSRGSLFCFSEIAENR
jgi:hypothetical protein